LGVQVVVQVPFWQVPPGQAVPSGAGGLEHCPVVGSQVPARWQASDAVHSTGVPVQTPAWHTSFWVQALPSLQAVPFGFA
jgi:hypothetical protein